MRLRRLEEAQLRSGLVPNPPARVTRAVGYRHVGRRMRAALRQRDQVVESEPVDGNVSTADVAAPTVPLVDSPSVDAFYRAAPKSGPSSVGPFTGQLPEPSWVGFPPLVDSSDGGTRMLAMPSEGLASFVGLDFGRELTGPAPALETVFARTGTIEVTVGFRLPTPRTPLRDCRPHGEADYAEAPT